LISEIVEQTSGEPLRNYSAEEWFADWLQGKKATKTDSTFLKYTNAAKRFLASLGPRAKLNVNQVAPRDVHRFRQGEVDAGKHPSTCNDHVKIVRMALTSARKQGYITHNPAEAVEMLPVDSEPAKQPFTLEQIKALLRNAHGDWRGAILLALYTGMRMKDVANLRWENVDLPNKWISFRAGKTRRRIKIPMHDALHEFLLELPAPDSGKAFLFSSLAGKSTGGKSGLSMAFSRVMGRAKVRGEIAHERKGESGRSVSTLSFHSLRHTLVSLMANAGVPVEVRQKFTGHASAEMNQHYTHHDIATLRAAISAIPSLGFK
jgi:integrase